MSATPGQAGELFASWAERSGMLARVTFEDSPDLAEAFAAGMQAQRDLDAAQEPHAADGVWTVAECLERIGDLAGALHEIKTAYTPGTYAHDLAHATLDQSGPAPQPAPELADLRERLARAEGDRNAARNVVAEMHAHWQRDGATPEQEELFPQWLAAAGLTDGATAEPQPAPELAAERDGLRKALRAISLGIAEPSPKRVADNALDGRYFDPETDAGVWSMSDPAEQVRLARQDRDQLRTAVLSLAAELENEAAASNYALESDALADAAARLRKTAEPPS